MVPIFSSVYILILASATVVAFLKVYQLYRAGRPSFQCRMKEQSEYRNAHWPMLALAIFLLLGAACEVTTQYLLPHGTTNHFLYAAYMLGTTASLFVFFNLLRPSKALFAYCLLLAVRMCGYYCYYRYWRWDTQLPYQQIASYHTVLAIGSLVFLVESGRKGPRLPILKSVVFGGIFLSYFVLGVLETGLVHDPTTSKSTLLSFFHWRSGINIAFYGALLLTISSIRVPRMGQGQSMDALSSTTS